MQMTELGKAVVFVLSCGFFMWFRVSKVDGVCLCATLKPVLV